ncbi:FxLD family lanthipeptide [Streptomyces virginiae]|uniref:FxLD family lanthipeptide n=1 Tax=Streptomyces TaxID=1883 RepID=UPI00207A5F1B|nr:MULTISPECIES: FxLD family lanthipeptide [Streptomyces]MCM9083183.1 FxLD family lanthipeptide [Streptomyces spororaveus]MCX4807080.1 FxLD family lanthipeptide [Streptomyces sp. NBC_01214]MCX5193158.1 FxLD family lanthipeptide [Streptomyces sp. NBC_00249]MCX5275016.1 FxLD family lanthipeptide [Streptomyces virginiae]MCX5308914.1 FxLD family lanthipeptide [Streptomyces sp. NBC_00160]
MTKQIATATTGLSGEFNLDVRVVEAGAPVASLLRSTDDGCGSTCSNGSTACASSVNDPS